MAGRVSQLQLEGRSGSAGRPSSAGTGRSRGSGASGLPRPGSAHSLGSGGGDADSAADGGEDGAAHREADPDHLGIRYPTSHRLQKYAQRDLLNAHMGRLVRKGASVDKVALIKRTNLAKWGIIEPDSGGLVGTTSAERKKLSATAAASLLGGGGASGGPATGTGAAKGDAGHGGAGGGQQRPESAPAGDASAGGAGLPDNNGGFLYHKMETAAERELHGLWLAKRHNEIAAAKNKAEVQRAIDNWQVNRNRLEEEIARKIESKRRRPPPHILPVRNTVREAFTPVMRPAVSYKGMLAAASAPLKKARGDSDSGSDSEGDSSPHARGGFGSIKPPAGEEGAADGAAGSRPVSAAGSRATYRGAQGGGGGGERPDSAASIGSRRLRLTTPIAIPKRQFVQPPMRYKTQRPASAMPLTTYTAAAEERERTMPQMVGARRRPASAQARAEEHSARAAQRKAGGIASIGAGAGDGAGGAGADLAEESEEDEDDVHGEAALDKFISEADAELAMYQAAADERKQRAVDEAAASAAAAKAMGVSLGGDGSGAASETASVAPSVAAGSEAGGAAAAEVPAGPPEPVTLRADAEVDPDFSHYPDRTRLSATAVEALTEIDAIKAAFIRKGMVVPVSLLERALVLRDDKTPEQVAALPAAGMGLPTNPCLAQKLAVFGGAKKKKKGKKKKGGKKKGKKKK